MHPLRLKRDEDSVKVFDPVRKRWLVLTPEEWVRQHLIQHLSLDFGYSTALMTTETAATRGARKGRIDLVAHSIDGVPLLLVECKRTDEAINQDVLMQAAAYNRLVGAKAVAVTNGLQTFHFLIDAASSGQWQHGLPTMAQISDLNRH